MSSFDLEHRLKPILKWAGGKSGPLAQLLAFFPSGFERFVEPFVGAGAVYLALSPGTPAWLNDSNSDLILLYETLRDDPNGLMAELDGLAARYSETFYYELRSKIPDTRTARVARTIFLNKTGYNGLYRLNGKGLFNVPFGKRTRCPALYEKENLIRVAERLGQAELKLTAVDFESVLDQCGGGDFVYCDPPYAPLSKTARFTSYTSNRFDQDDQQRLERACRRAAERGAWIALSNSSAAWVEQLYESNGWRLHSIQAKRAINSKVSARGTIGEVLACLGYHGQKKAAEEKTLPRQ